jgi:hypothetical protein
MQLKHAACAQFEACQARRNHTGAFGRVLQPTIRRVHVCTAEGGENFENLLRIALHTQQEPYRSDTGNCDVRRTSNITSVRYLLLAVTLQVSSENRHFQT